MTNVWGLAMLPLIRPLTADEKRAVGMTWFNRAQREAHLGVRFDSLFQALRAHQATPTVITLAEQTANDSNKHAETYRSIAREFGVDHDWTVPKRLGPLAPADFSILQRIIYELVALSCIQETLTGSLMGEIYKRAKYPRIRLTAHLAFQDEIWHSRLGWAHLGNVAKQTSVSWLAPTVPLLLKQSTDHELFRVDDEHYSDALADYGELSADERRKIWQEVINTIILPGLESMGIDMSEGKAWMAQFGS